MLRLDTPFGRHGHQPIFFLILYFLLSEAFILFKTNLFLTSLSLSVSETINMDISGTKLLFILFTDKLLYMRTRAYTYVVFRNSTNTFAT